MTADFFTCATCGHATHQHDIRHGTTVHPCTVCDCRYYDAWWKASLRGDNNDGI